MDVLALWKILFSKGHEEMKYTLEKEEILTITQALKSYTEKDKSLIEFFEYLYKEMEENIVLRIN